MTGLRAAVLVALAAAAPVALGACESTQETSRRLSSSARASLDVKGVTVTKRNPDVTVLSETVLHDVNGVAAVVRVRNRGPAQAKVPVGIAVKDAKGRTLYSNSIPGLDPSLTSLPVIGRGEETFWVNNQIQTATAPRRVAAVVGAAVPARGSLPRIVVGRPAFGTDTSGVFARARITNRSKVAQKRLVVSCVSRRGGSVVAAGRAIVEKLLPAPTPKPVTFRVYFIGNPRRGALTCAAPPTVLSGGSTS